MSLEVLLAIRRPATLGPTWEAVERALAKPALFRQLFGCLPSESTLVRWRAADTIDKVTARRPDLLLYSDFTYGASGITRRASQILAQSLNSGGRVIWN